MSTGDKDSRYPRSVRHKQILDKAAENPDASMDELASMVPSATTELVERTLDEYGDPATADESDEGAEDEMNDQDGGSDSAGQAGSAHENGASPPTPVSEESGETDDSEAGERGVVGDDGDDDAHDAEAAAERSTLPSQEELSPKQLEVLQYVATHPAATQREIGERLGVSSATVNNRVNSIDGFEWSNRRSFVRELFDFRGSPADRPEESTSGLAQQSSVDELERRLEALEERIESGESGDSASAFDDPELVHKVVHACMESDRLSEDDEVRVLQDILD